MPVHASYTDLLSVAPRAAERVTKFDIMAGGKELRYRSYERASQDAKGKGDSVASQGKKNRDRGKRWTRIGGDYVDNDRPASPKAKEGSRPEYERLVEDIRRDPGDVLIFFEMARGARDVDVYLKLRKLCQKNGPYFWMVGTNLYDVRDPGDRQSLLSMASQAEGGSDNISTAVLLALQGQAESGRPHGQTPYGYRRVYHKSTHDVIGQEIDDTERDGGWSPAGVVRGIFADYLARKPMAHIVRDLNDAGIPSPRRLGAIRSEDAARLARSVDARWTTTSVFNILKNVHYIGVRLHHGAMASEKAMWQGLVSQENFFEVGARLKRRGMTIERPTAAQTLLTCLAYCRCGEVMVHQPRRDGLSSYRCRKGDSQVPALAADQFVGKAMVLLLSDPAVASRVRVDDSPESVEAQARAETLRAELAAWKIWAKDPEREDVTAADYSEVSADLLPKIREAEGLATRSVPGILADSVGPDAEAKWGRRPLPVKRELLKIAVRIEVSPAGRGNRNAPLEDRIKLSELF